MGIATSPILVTGVYRSGTTLLSRILNNNSKLSITYDNVHFMRFCHNRFEPVSKPENYKSLLENIKKRVDKRMGIDWNTEPVEQKIRSMDTIEYAYIYNEVMKSIIQESPEHRWGEKTMICWTRIPDFLQMFPKGKAIHVIRDTRDVLSSFKKVTNEPGLRYFDAVFTTFHSMTWAATEGRKLPESNYLLVKYEDLVMKPEKTVKMIARFLEVDFESSMLDYTKFEDRTKKEQWRANTAYEKSIKGIDNSSVGKFKNKLTSEEIFFAEIVAKSMLVHYGYELTGIYPSKEEWNNLYSIISDEFVSKRFKHWLKTNQGVEDYPSPPPEVYRKKGLDRI